ncbi:MAG: uroporphyrinogen decarboxylase family protein [Planctomycetota bacterium]
MSGRPTDHANLDLCQLNLDVAFGRAGGKIIWQPRIGAWLDYKRFKGIPLPDWCEGKNAHEILREMGVSARLYDFNACFESHEDPAVTHHREVLDESRVEYTIETPVGNMTAIIHSSEDNFSQRQRKWFVTTEDDLRIATWRAERTTWIFNQKLYDELVATYGDLGAPQMYMPRTNVQGLYIDYAGVEGGIMLMYDSPDLVAGFFAALDDSHDRLCDVLKDSPVQLVNFGDNVHADTCSPKLFEKYVLPAYQRRCEKLHQAGKFVFAHWDGNCKALLPYVHDTGMDGVEAITPIPQGDVTLDGRGG